MNAIRSVALACAVAAGAMVLVGAALPVRACTTPGTLTPLGAIIDACAPGCGPAATAGATLPRAGENFGAFSAGSGGSSTTGDTGPVLDVSIVDFAFLPEVSTITPESTVRWTNNGFFQHSSRRTGTGAWDTGFLNAGQDASVLFNASTAGLAFDYVCGVHPFNMFGTIEVVHFGDANMDKQVDLDDFNILATNFNTSGHDWSGGDFSGDGNVDLDDFNLLAGSFGQSVQPAFTSGGALAAIPEPATLLSGVVASAIMSMRRRLVRRDPHLPDHRFT